MSELLNFQPWPVRIAALRLRRVAANGMGFSCYCTNFSKIERLATCWAVPNVVAFISFPITTFSAIAFGVMTGLTWLSTVAPTSSLVALMFGTRWLATLYGVAFFSHQVGGSLAYFSAA